MSGPKVKRLLLAAVAFSSIVAVLLVVLQPGLYDQSQARHISVGMSLGEVEALFGGPGVEPGADIKKYTSPPQYLKRWPCGEVDVLVCFDEDDAVVGQGRQLHLRFYVLHPTVAWQTAWHLMKRILP
jgi:hypothetical protein